MPLQWKINVLAALKEKGYNTNKIRTEGLLSQSTLQKLREGKGVAWENLESSVNCWSASPPISWSLPQTKSRSDPAPISGKIFFTPAFGFCVVHAPTKCGFDSGRRTFTAVNDRSAYRAPVAAATQRFCSLVFKAPLHLCIHPLRLGVSAKI